MTNEATSNLQADPSATSQTMNSGTAKPTMPTTTEDIQKKFHEMGADTKHIAYQTDRIAAHLLNGPPAAHRNAAQSLMAQLDQIVRNQALLIRMVEEIFERLPQAQPVGEAAKSQ